MPLGSSSRSGTEIDSADANEPLQSYLLSSSPEQNIFLSAVSISSCVEVLEEFGDRALQPSYDPWATVDFHGRAKIHADLTKTYKDVRVATNVEKDADVTLSSEGPQNILPQRKVPAQRRRIDLSKTLRLLLQKLLLQNSVLLVLMVAMMFRDLCCIMLNVVF